MPRRHWRAAPAAALLLLAVAVSAQSEPAADLIERPPVSTSDADTTSDEETFNSRLWGTTGNFWSAAGPITDQAYAGYMGQNKRIPTYTKIYNVRDAAYGAKGDGETDDTAAVLKALAAASAAANLLSTVPCGYKNARRCPLEQMQNGGNAGVVVYLPAGRYKITQTIEIKQSNVVIRGAGIGKTTLWFPKGLAAIYGTKKQWATGGAFLIINGNNSGSNQKQYALTDIKADARRGDKILRVADTSKIAVGQFVRIYALAKSPARRRQLLAAAAPATPAQPAGRKFLPLTAALKQSLDQAAYEEGQEAGAGGVSMAAQGGTLDAYLYGENLVASGTNSFADSDHIRFLVKVTAKGQDWIKLERPLPYDVRVRWNPKVYNYYSTVQHSGIEGMTLHFNFSTYPSHLKTNGFNAIEMQSVTNCWARNLQVIDADLGVHLSQCDLVTVDNYSMEVTAPRWTASTAPDNGHHALWVSKCGVTLFENFAIKDPYMHDLSVDIFSETVVFSKGYGKNMNIDCHRAGPHNHLFSDLDMGFGTRPFKSGGDKPRGAYAGANNTFWNLRASLPAANPPLLQLPECDFGPLLNFIGRFSPPPSLTPVTQIKNSKGKVTKTVPKIYKNDAVFVRRPDWCNQTRWYVEIPGPKQAIQPADLFDAMVATRKARLGF